MINLNFAVFYLLITCKDHRINQKFTKPIYKKTNRKVEKHDTYVKGEVKYNQ